MKGTFNKKVSPENTLKKPRKIVYIFIKYYCLRHWLWDNISVILDIQVTSEKIISTSKIFSDLT